MFDINNLNPTCKFFFEDSEDEWVELRIASEQDNKDIFKKAGIRFEKKLVYNKAERRMEELRGLDANEAQQDRFNEEVWDFSIVDWNLMTPKGEEIPCTRENKVKLMRQSPKFASWIGDCLETAREGSQIRKSDEIKN